MIFYVGAIGPLKDKKGRYHFVKLKTNEEVKRAQDDFDTIKGQLQGALKGGTKPHPVLPATVHRNANQKTCNRISTLIDKMNLRF